MQQLVGPHTSTAAQRHTHVPLSSRARLIGRPCSRARRVDVQASHSPFKVQLLHPVKVPDADTRPLLVFLPGTDGTGQAITPQLPGLLAAGYDIRTLYVPPDDRSGWEQLQAQVLYLLAQTLAARPEGPHNIQVTLLAESFGGCLALRLAAAAPHLVKSLVLLNPATCYNQSLNGLSSFVSATNLLGLFPQDLYNTAQAVLLPFLVDIDRVGPEGAAALRSMIFMEAPPDYETAAEQQLYDDPEQSSRTTLSPDRRLIQANTSNSFTSAGPARQQHTNRLQADTAAATAAAGGSWGLLAGGREGRGRSGDARSGVFGPAAAANFRSNLLRSGDLPDRLLRRIDTPTLLLASAKDRMLPSLAEAARLNRLLPRSRRVMLPDSGHAALLERGMDLATIMRGAGVTPKPRHTHKPHTAAPTPTLTSTTTTAGGGGGGGAGAATTAAAGAAAAVGGGGEVVRVRLPDSSSSSKQVKHKGARIIRVVKDDKVLPGSRGADGAPSPRPATVMPRSTAGAAAGAGSSSSQVQQYSHAAAAGAAATMAAGVVGTGGGAATAAADAGSSQQLAMAVNGSNGWPPSSAEASSSSSSSRTSQSPAVLRLSSASDKDLAWDEWSQLLAPWRDLVSPVLLGQEHLPRLVGCGRPLLFVGNHQKMGLYDMPLFVNELFMRGFKVRGLAHPAHWGGPLGRFFEQFGAVPAGPMTAYKLLKANEQVLLFPGGAREVNKKVGQEYQLFWRESPDFVRLAARCGAIIVPFAAVGADDAYDVMMEADELLEVPVLGNLVKAALQRFDAKLDPAEAALPLTRLPGLGLPTPVPIPNLQRLYFKVCAPIDTTQLGLDVKKDAEGWQQLYDSIRHTVYSGMDELLRVQAADDQRNVGSRISKALQSWQPAFNITQAPPGAAGTAEEAAAADAVRQGVALQRVSMDGVSSLSSISSLSSMGSLDMDES